MGLNLAKFSIGFLYKYFNAHVYKNYIYRYSIYIKRVQYSYMLDIDFILILKIHMNYLYFFIFIGA